jgi:hypothetical protein
MRAPLDAELGGAVSSDAIVVQVHALQQLEHCKIPT